MVYRNRCARVNIKVLVILIVVVVGLGVGLVAARQIRRKVLSARDLRAGTAAFENENWLLAYEHFIEYLGRNPNDVEILKKCAKARLSARPVRFADVRWAIGVYRQMLRLDPNDAEAYAELASLYGGLVGIPAYADELAYIARKRLELQPGDKEAPLWLVNALIQQGKLVEAREVLEALIPQLSPDQVEYEQACVAMSMVLSGDDPVEAFKWISRAVGDPPDSAMPLVQRARFCRVVASSPDRALQTHVLEVAGHAAAGTDPSAADQLLALTRQDLEAAESLQSLDAKVRYAIVKEWMALGDLERATAAVKACDELPDELLREQFLDPNDWVTARFTQESELLRRRGAAREAATEADEVLETLTEPGHRVEALRSAIPIYAAACDVLKGSEDANGVEARVENLRACVDEYREILQVRQQLTERRDELTEFEALLARAEGRPYAVINTLQTLVAGVPSNVRVWQMLGEAYVQTDQARRAIDALEHVLDRQPDNEAVAREVAGQYAKLGDQSGVVRANKIVEALDPTNVAAKLLRIGGGIQMALEGDPNAPEVQGLSAELKQLRAAHPERADVRVLQAALAKLRGDPNEAVAELKRAIAECDNPLEAQIQLVNEYRAEERMAEAIATCRQACEEHADVPGPLLMLAGLYVAEGDVDAAIECLTRRLEAIQVDLAGEGSASTKRLRAREKRPLAIALALLERSRQNDAACIEILTELAAEDQQDVQARVILLSVLEDAATAEKLIAELKNIEGDSGLQWRLHQAIVWLSSDQWRAKQQDIVALLRYCISADSQWSEPVLRLGSLYYGDDRLRDPSQAIQVYEAALAANPSDAEIAGRLLAVLSQEGRFDEAEAVLKRIKVNPRLASAWEVQTALQTGDVSRAIGMLEASLSATAPSAESLIQLARLVYRQSGDTERAFEYLRQAEELAPDLPALITVRASIYRAEGEPEKAKAVLDAYVAERQDFTAYRMRAGYLVEEGDLAGAEQDYLQLKALDDPNGDGTGRLLLSDFYAGQGNLDQAIAELEEALGLKLFSEAVRLKRRLMQRWLERGQEADKTRVVAMLDRLEKGRPDDKERPDDVDLMKIRVDLLLSDPRQTPESLRIVREKLERITEREPGNVRAQLVLIDVAMQNKEYEAARALAIKAIGANPDNAELLMARCRAELQLGNTRAATELARLVQQDDPGNVDSMVMLANARRIAGDLDEADQWLTRAETVAPDRMAVIHARFLWRVAQRQFEQLAGISSTYCSASEQDLRFILEAAAILGGLDSADLKQEAVKLFEYALTLKPGTPGIRLIRLALATTLYQMGDAERAETVYRELLQETPENPAVLNDLAWILQEHDKNYEEALALTRRGLQLAPDNVHLLDTRGTILMNMQGRLADAKVDFQKILELSASDARRQAKASLQLGRICMKRNELAEARQHLQKAVEIDREIAILTPEEKAEIEGVLN